MSESKGFKNMLKTRKIVGGFAAVGVLATLLLPISVAPATAHIGTVPQSADITGSDRFETAVLVSKHGYPAGNVNTVYVASGSNYPDALSAGSIAAKQKAPLLITHKDVLPETIKQEIVRLSPSKIVLVGGTAAVGSNVEQALKPLANTVTRVAGKDRYETSRLLVESVFTTGRVRVAWLATGTNYPDALSAGAAAGKMGGFVLLVDGRQNRIDQTTANLLTRLEPYRVNIVGGENVINASMQASARALTTSNGRFMNVNRVGGVDRFHTSKSVFLSAWNNMNEPDAGTAYLATGYDFPDALTVSAVAGAQGKPVLTVPGKQEWYCLAVAATHALDDRQGIRSYKTVGGVHPAPASNANCPPHTWGAHPSAVEWSGPGSAKGWEPAGLVQFSGPGYTPDCIGEGLTGIGGRIANGYFTNTAVSRRVDNWTDGDPNGRWTGESWVEGNKAYYEFFVCATTNW